MGNREDSVWKAVPGDLMTRWAKDVNCIKVLPEYPRPQMVRNSWINLNGLWNYAVSSKNEVAVSEYGGEILVPFPIEAALSGVKKPLLPEDRLWYRRIFSVPDQWKGQRVLLHFGAVDWEAEVWINKNRVGKHTGGYYPFSFEISQYLKDGENEVVVGVLDPTDTYGQERGKQVLKPSGIFYTPVSGIWQTVWLEPVPKNYIKSHRMTPNIDEEELSISIEMGGESNGLEFQALAYDKGELIASEKTLVGEVLKLKISKPKLWSPESPFLYDIKIRLIDKDKTVDEITSYFGMRKYSLEKDSEGLKRLFLNNKPLFQNGVLDQGYWPDGLYTAPTDEALEYDVIMSKKLGFNMIRKHIKVEPARWYYHCDRLGMIVWQDMINGGAAFNIFNNTIKPMVLGLDNIKDNKYKAFGRNEKSNRDNYRKELKEMIDALYNVPCIGMWVPFNEAWGQFDAAETAQWVRKYDPTRCVDHASGWYDQKVGDIKSVHIYFRKLKMPKRINERAVVISEYGGYSLLEKGHVWREGKEFGYKKFKTRTELQAAYVHLIKNQVKPMIQKGLSAVIYTQITDVETEINGILTYDREVIKMDIDVLNGIHKELYTVFQVT